jgi:hypothetical protein
MSTLEIFLIPLFALSGIPQLIRNSDMNSRQSFPRFVAHVLIIETKKASYSFDEPYKPFHPQFNRVDQFLGVSARIGNNFQHCRCPAPKG